MKPNVPDTESFSSSFPVYVRIFAGPHAEEKRQNFQPGDVFVNDGCGPQLGQSVNFSVDTDR